MLCAQVGLAGSTEIGKNVILVEDILDTGLTMGYLRKLFLAHQPRALRLPAGRGAALRAEMRQLLEERRQAHLVSDKRAAVQPGRFDYTLSGLLLALRDIADCDSDVDAFIETYEG